MLRLDDGPQFRQEIAKTKTIEELRDVALKLHAFLQNKEQNVLDLSAESAVKEDEVHGEEPDEPLTVKIFL